jgi:hypothetical protein
MDKTTELGNSLPETLSNAMKTLDYGLQYRPKKRTVVAEERYKFKI